MAAATANRGSLCLAPEWWWRPRAVAGERAPRRPRETRRAAFDAMRGLCAMARAAEAVDWVGRSRGNAERTARGDDAWGVPCRRGPAPRRSDHAHDVAQDDV